MQRELWYPSLHPPVEHFMLSVLYGEGFASVLPSWTLREGHPAWAELEALQDLGLYEPLRLRDLLQEPGVEGAVPATLMGFAHQVSVTPTASERLRDWSRAVLAGEPMAQASGPPAGSAMTLFSGGLGSDEAFVARQRRSAVQERLMARLTRDFAFSVDDSGTVLQAPREVIDQVVRVAVGHAAINRPGLIPTTEVFSRASSAGIDAEATSQAAWWVQLPAPPPGWTLSEVLRVREQNDEALHRLRETLQGLPPPEPGVDASDIKDHLTKQLRRDLSRIRREFGDDPRRRYLRLAGLMAFEAGAGELAATALPDWGLAGAVGLAVITGLGMPRVGEHVVRAASGRIASVAYAKPAALSAGRAWA